MCLLFVFLQGSLLSVSCCPDSPFVFSFGGEKQGLQVLDITACPPGNVCVFVYCVFVVFLFLLQVHSFFCLHCFSFSMVILKSTKLFLPFFFSM